MTTGKLILELAQAIERLDDGQREHYRLLSKALLNCYVNGGQRAAVIIGREPCIKHEVVGHYVLPQFPALPYPI